MEFLGFVSQGSPTAGPPWAVIFRASGTAFRDVRVIRGFRVIRVVFWLLPGRNCCRCMP